MKNTPKKTLAGKTSKPQTGYIERLRVFAKQHWVPFVIILVLTCVFFWPLIIRAGSYSEGGDAMFNAWTLARDQHCVLRQACPNYDNGNIYFPHKDSMLYSETQLSAGLVTLPLYAINKNPIFSYNIWTIASCLFSGLAMYLLAIYLSKGNKLFSVLAGLIFEFAPLKMAGMGHLQNLSIFCLPLAVLLILKYLDRRSRNYLWLLLLVLIYQFYASWYQMVFVLVALGVMLLSLYVFRLANWRKLLVVGAVIAVAALTTFPLAREYIRFSKANNASFSTIDQTAYSSSVADYLIPFNQTLEGKLYYSHINKEAQVNAYNLDSYSYDSLILYVVAGFILLTAFIALVRRRSKTVDKEVFVFALIGFVGLIASFGPLLKIKGDYLYGSSTLGLNLAIPMPYLLVDKLLPQLHFIRAIGRISVLFLFALCCLLVYLPLYLNRASFTKTWKTALQAAVVILIIFELMPTHILATSPNIYAYGHTVPTAYQYIRKHSDINDIVILRTHDYKNAPFPVVRAEDVIWAGYDNRNIFNGYSGYEPPEYGPAYGDFVDFHADDIAKTKKLGLKYVLVDKQLSSPDSQLITGTKAYLRDKVYEDNRYVLYKL
jgi:hypothetical protein